MSRPARGGLTLVEVVCAGALLALCLTPAMSSLSYAQMLLADARQRAMACRALEARVEAIHATHFSEVAPATTTITLSSLPCTFVTSVSYPRSPETRLQKVTVSVSWRGPSGQTYSHWREFLRSDFRQ